MEFNQGSYTQDFKEFAQEHLYVTCSCKEARTCNEPHMFVDQSYIIIGDELHHFTL